MIYIHLPFCHSRCIYCNFFATASRAGRDGFEELIVREARQRRDFLTGEALSSVYFGGGTPSLLKPQQLAAILDTIRQEFRLESGAEITLEANPEDINKENCRAWLDMGFNRMSIGVQSFRDEDLIWLGRRHSALSARKGIETALECGFTEISIDLIYGIPGQELADWNENLRIFSGYQLPHLSSYWLTVEPATPLERLLRTGKKEQAPEASGEAHFQALMDWADISGYEHYEISNFCLPGHYSRHNSSYWNGKPYLGLGPSAHSFRPGYRCWNPSSIEEYRKGVEEGSLPRGEENLSHIDRFNERIMLGLRTKWGVNLKALQEEFGTIAEAIERKVIPLLREDLLKSEDSTLFITRKGKLLADGIASSLFCDER